jgi:hypothetical protein
MFRQVRQVTEPGVGDLRVFEPADDRRGVQLRVHGLDDRLEVLAVLATGVVVAKSWIGGELGPQEHRLAEPRPLPVVLHAEEDGAAVTRLERPVRRERGMVQSGTGRGRTAVRRVIEGVAEPLGQCLQQRDLECLAVSGPLPFVQRGEDATEGVHSAGDVGDRDSRLDLLVGGSGDRGESALALDEQVVGLLVAVRPARTVPGDAADDQAWMVLAKPSGRQAEAVGGTGREVLDEDVGAFQQPPEDLPLARPLEVEGDGLLAPVEPDEMARHAARRRVVPTGEVPAVRALDLDHSGAEVRELPRRERRGDRLFEGDDGHTVQGKHDD